jgi:outer membrane protein assembly factor BamB
MQRCNAAVFWALIIGSAGAAEPWSTYRGNLQRTGNTDNVAGPAVPKVLWVHKSTEHFIAAPVPAGDRVHVSGLGAFNVSTFSALAVDPKAAQRVVWSKTTPYLKLPTVSSPAISDGKLIFGDGMHQTDGAVLHCLRAEKGLPLWQLPVPGKLVHLEGSPTVSDGRAYLGGGAAGVLCVDCNRVTLDGKEMDLSAIQKVLEKRWSELLAAYEADKKKDPDFAVPPSEDQLPKPAPVTLWRQGQERWHVDAPVAVLGDRVLVASAYLDDEKVGDRALFCLDAKSGEVRWRAPLRLNPWGGPSAQDNVIIVGGSSIRYDPKLLKGAKGEIVALDLATGKEKWRKEVPGGVVSCVALSEGLAIATATDGKVRAFNLADGDRRWIQDCKTAFFAAVAVTAGTVYAGDLRGIVYALNLADGKPKWTLDLGSSPDVKAPGMIYAGPVLQGGRLFIATCNLEGPFVRQACVVVCIGEK